MLRAGALPEVPDAVIQAVEENRAQIDVEYQGPLAVANRAAGIDAVQRVLSVLVPMSEAAPEMLDVLDNDNIARYVAKTGGLPADLIRSVEQIQAIRENRAQAKQQEAQREEMESTAKAIGKVTPALKQVTETAGAEA